MKKFLHFLTHRRKIEVNVPALDMEIIQTLKHEYNNTIRAIQNARSDFVKQYMIGYCTAIKDVLGYVENLFYKQTDYLSKGE